MADFKFADRADFQKMVDAEIEETLTLEYKASPALKRGSDEVRELCKDVSAMANSAGGQIIYGIEEDKKTHKPSKVDDGVTDPKITREWLLQILNSNIQPRIDGLGIQRIKLSDDGYGYVISVEPTLTGPHQAPDKKYYKRFALEVRAMEDYEIRDVMARATSPLLVPQLTFDGRVVTNYGFTSNPDASASIPINVLLRNASTAPAEYTGFSIGFDRSLLITAYPPLMSIGHFDDGKGNTLQWYSRRVGIPADFPIFKELPLEIVPRNTAIKVPEHARWEKEFLVCARIQAPGFSAEHYWSIKNGDQRLQIVEQV